MRTCLPETTAETHLMRVTSLVERFLSEIGAAAPKAQAYDRLSSDGLGCTEFVYNDEALAAFQDCLRNEPESIEVLHHLAVMHHARAFDLELSATPSAANEDWQSALQYWNVLCRSDEFWQRETSRLAAYEQHAQIIQRLRRSLPGKLMRIHCDIALDPETPVHRVQFHIRLLRSCGFDAHIKQTLLSEVYDSYLRFVPPEVWSDACTDSKQLQLGLEAIDQYLSLDPESLTAKTEALRLQVRLLQGWFLELNDLPDSVQPKREQLLEMIRASGDYWRNRFAGLATVKSELTSTSRDELALWFRVMGEVACATGRRQTAMEHLDGALQMEPSDPGELKRCRDARDLVRALTARDNSVLQRAGAREECLTLVQEQPTSALVYAILADALLAWHEFDAAESVCLAGIRMEPMEFELSENLHEVHRQQLERRLEQVRNARTMQNLLPEVELAETAIRRGAWETALDHLKSVRAACPEDMKCLILQFRCHLQLLDLSQAERDLAEFRRRFSDSYQTIIESMSDQIAGTKADLQRFGIEVAALLRQADSARGAGCAAEEETYLRQAYSQGNETGKAEVGPRLAHALWRRAFSALREVLEKPAATAAERLSICTATQAAVEEILTFDSGADYARRESESLVRLIAQFRHHVEQEQQRNSLVQEFGSLEALNCHQRALAEWNRDSRREALASMREARRHSPQSVRIARDLAAILHGVAVHLLKFSRDDRSADLQSAYEYLSEAVILHPENTQLHHELDAVYGQWQQARTVAQGVR